MWEEGFLIPVAISAVEGRKAASARKSGRRYSIRREKEQHGSEEGRGGMGCQSVKVSASNRFAAPSVLAWCREMRAPGFKAHFCSLAHSCLGCVREKQKILLPSGSNHSIHSMLGRRQEIIKDCGLTCVG